MTQEVEAFYDALSPAFVRDYVKGNKRVERQFQFFKAAIEPGAKSILVIGCGSGEGAHFVATCIAKNAKILAVDISGANIKLARALFSHQHIEYRKCDVLTEDIPGRWDIIILPDVYEHIPLKNRGILHGRMAKWLSVGGRILLTVPSEQTQRSLNDPSSGHKPQIVDEIVSLSDLAQLAKDTDALLTYFAVISVWHSNDYVQAIVERNAHQGRTLKPLDQVPIKAGLPPGASARLATALRKKLGFASLNRWRRLRRVTRLRQHSG